MKMPNGDLEVDLKVSCVAVDLYYFYLVIIIKAIATQKLKCHQGSTIM